MSEQVLSKINKLIIEAKGNGKTHVTFHGDMAEVVKSTLQNRGYQVSFFTQGKCYVIDWQRKGKASGKISIPVILELMKGLAGNIRNTLCSIFTF